MLFKQMYNNVDKIFPKLNLPDKNIPDFIYNQYYFRTGKRLNGSFTIIQPNVILIKDKDTINYEYAEVIHDNGIIKLFIVPYNIDRYSFEVNDRLIILYEIFSELCSEYNPKTEYIKTIFKHAPFVLTLFMSMEETNPIKYTELYKLINDKYNTNYTDEFVFKIMSMDIDKLLDMGGILPMIEEYLK